MESRRIAAVFCMLVVVAAFAARSAAQGSAADSSPDAPGQTTPAATPPTTKLDSPRAAMFAFLAAMNDALLGRAEAWPQAMATLDLSAATPEQDPKLLAERLKGVLDRLGEVRESELPDAATVKREKIRRFAYFPQPHHAWVWEQLGHAPDGSIVLEADEAGVWRFSARTVAGAEALWASVKDLPPIYEPARAPAHVLSVLGPTFELTPGWAWGMLLISIFLGLVIGKLVQTVLRRSADRLESKQWRVRATVFRSAANPAALALLALGIFVGLGFIHMEADIRAFSSNILTFLFLVALGWLLYNLVDVVELLILNVTSRTASTLDDMVVPLIRKSLRIFLIIVFTLVVAQNVFGLNVTGWLAGLGIAGLAVSLAAQDSIKNLFGSMTVFFDRPFTVGDFVQFDGHTGTIEEIGFRSTRLRLAGGSLVTIPNMRFIDGKIENISARPHIRREMNITVPYDTPPDKVEQAVEIVKSILTDPQVVEEGRFDMTKSPPRVAFDALNADSLNIKAYYWYQLQRDKTRGFYTYLAHAQLVNVKLLRAFNEAGIEFAFPTQLLYLADDPQRKLAVAVRQGEG